MYPPRFLSYTKKMKAFGNYIITCNHSFLQKEMSVTISDKVVSIFYLISFNQYKELIKYQEYVEK